MKRIVPLCENKLKFRVAINLEQEIILKDAGYFGISINSL